ncbi:MAG TPA: helix-turn-helix domain-containing protein [Ktedonobacterales bacterium]|jgi:predicted ATPase/DNA-binding XRE family transcriptional regulator|nr:helix-turn-helix domain-containing protein [Ktedonobacterales bacterium]
MAEQTTLSATLKRYRLAAGLSQEELAERAGLSVRAVSDLERGLHRTARGSTINLLASALALAPEQRAALLSAARPELVAPQAAPAADSLVFSAPPSPPTALVGRERERRQAREALLERGVRLLTLMGPGGVGKTRLALQIAWDVASAFPDGVVFVDLAPIRDAALVASALVEALGLRGELGATPMPAMERALAFLSDRRTLILLDNFEQLLDAAPALARLLQQCSQVALLVTSRAALQVRAEQRLLVEPLEASVAAELFCARAHATQPGVALPADDIEAICAQVDHLPLAIELAAAQLSALSTVRLRERLAQRLPPLIGRLRDLPARQQTMEATIAWSYELLNAEQQRWFRGLGVFAGGWTAEAAHAVCGDSDAHNMDATLRALADLVEASLVRSQVDASGMARFSQLESLREFARLRLRAAGEERMRAVRHARYYAQMAEIISRDGPPTRLPGHPARLDAVVELANARAALEWAEAAGEAELGMRLAGFGRLWHVLGQIAQALEWQERMLALDARVRATGVGVAAPPALRVERYYARARTLLGYGEYERAEASAAEAVRLSVGIDDDYVASNALMTLGMVTQAVGRFDEAASAFTAGYERMPADDTTGQRYRALSKLAEIAAIQGNLPGALTLLERAQADAEAMGNLWDVAHMATLLGRVACQMQRYSLATQRYQRALGLFRDFASPTFSAWCLEGYAAVLAGEGRHAQATRLLAACGALREQARTPAPPAEREAAEQLLVLARSALGRAAFRREWQAGAARTQDEALDEALAACALRLNPEVAADGWPLGAC